MAFSLVGWRCATLQPVVHLVQKALGHADVSTTMLYTHLVDDDMETALKRFHLG